MSPPPDDNVSPAVIVYGTVCLDQVIRLDENGIPLGPPREISGGEAFNTATALAGWGVPVLLTGTALGQCAESDRLRHLLDDPVCGLSRRRIPELPSAVTPVCTITVSSGGERLMCGRGYSEALAPPPLPDCDFARRPVFAVDPNLGEAAVAEALRAASLGCRVVAMDFQQHPEVCGAAYLVQTSREHLCRFPLPGGRDASLEASAEVLVVRGANRVVITDGANGGVVAERVEDGGVRVWHFRAVPVPAVVDTTGAGDAFRAGLCWGLLQESPVWPLDRLVRFAGAAAALHCQVPGSSSRSSLEAVRRLSGITV